MSQMFTYMKMLDKYILSVLLPVILCQDSNYICEDGAEIKLSQLCDGYKHCDDGSDEIKKICYHIICPPQMFRCHYGACVDKKSKCDGVAQCADQSDESQCGKQLGSCNIDEFRCDSGQCIQTDRMCDGKADCDDESDENDDTCEDLLCPENSFHCKHAGCIHLDAMCNGYKDCADGSDESEILCKSLNCKDYECNKIEESISCGPINSQRLSVTCESISGTTKGWVPCNKPMPINTKVKYQCKDYYVPASKKHQKNTHMTCQMDGSWNREHLKCEPECGKIEPNISPLIVHGWVSEPGQYPWHAVLYVLQAGNWIFWCGGSLITEKIVLTAAHCTWSITSNTTRIALGKYYSNYEKRQDFTQMMDVEEIIMHPLYQDFAGNYGSDIAIVVMQQNVEFSPYIRPVCIDWNFKDITQQLSENSLGLIVGMGIKENDTLSETLRVTHLPVVSDKECITQQTRDFKKYITYTTFCAGWLNGTGVCNGDSGGGLIFPKPNDRTTWVLQGIVSVSPRRLGTSFCDPLHYTIFTKVGMFVHWIQSMVKKIHSEEENIVHIEDNLIY